MPELSHDRPEPDPRTPGEDLVTDEGVNEGASEMVEESPEADE